VLDIYDYCTERIQDGLRRNRIAYNKKLEAALETSAGKSGLSSDVPPPVAGSVEKVEDSNAMEVDNDQKDEIVNFGEGIPSDFTGKYELIGIVTHKGRSADSGHYIGWVRQSPGSQLWWKYDDDKVSEVGMDEIMNLKGSGDWHTAYLNFYRFRV
jgi:ubiquitin carboxyl-terminal hydrolase 14